jgi:hypothetical protein
MKLTILAALLITTAAAPALAQNVQGQTSESTSGAAANSGSLSGAQSNNTANNNTGIGTSQNENTSSSGSAAISGSASESTSNSNGNTQGQSQGQQANNAQDQGQSQGQMQDQNQALDSSQANSQGVTVNQTWNTKNRRETEVRTNNAVPLTSSSSFSSDYCGGTVSGGASAAPLGISIGASKPSFDKSCQSLRRAEKFGMAAVNALNMGQAELSGRLMSMMIWSICTSDSYGTDRERDTASACDRLALLGSAANTTTAQPKPGETPTAKVARNGKITPEAAVRALASNQVQAEQIAASKPPR